MNGTQYAELIANKRGIDRENALRGTVKNGQFPSVFSDRSRWKRVRMNAVIGSQPRWLDIFVAPDFFAVGSDDDPFYTGGWTDTAQEIANRLGAVLPSKRMANEIQHQGEVRVGLMETTPGAPWYKAGGIPGDIEASGAFIDSNRKRNARIVALAGPSPSRWNKLVVGHMKDILTKAGGLSGGCPGGQCVTIYGGLGGAVDGWAIQGKNSSSHVWNYGPDYSHGIRLIAAEGKLDTGEAVDLRRIALDPTLHPLLSDEGPFDLRIPPPKGSALGPVTKSGPVDTNAVRAGGSLLSSPGFIFGGILAGIATLAWMSSREEEHGARDASEDAHGDEDDEEDG